MFFAAFLTLLFTFMYFWYTSYFRKVNRMLRNVPGPPTHPLLGNSLDFRNKKEVLSTMMTYISKYGPVCKMRLGLNLPMVIFSDTKSIGFILSHSKELRKSANYQFLEKWLGNGLLLSHGEKWRTHRKVITPAFHWQVLRNFVEVFDKASNVLVKQLEEVEAVDSFDVYSYLNLCSLDIICESAMGTVVNAQLDRNSQYVKCVKMMCRIVLERSFSVIKMKDFLYRLTNDYKIEQDCLKILHDYTNGVIQKKKEEVNNRFNTKRLGFLDLLLQESNRSENPLTDAEIREEVDTFMFEGHDTTATTMSFAMFCLANHPDVQQKAVEELDVIFDGDCERSPTFEDLKDMKYLHLILKESLRLFPGVPLYRRQLMEDTNYDGTIIPKGVTVIVFAYAVHRDPRIYNDPERFIPERFLGDENRSSFAYVPFSAGLRNCIGQKFALLEMKAVISKVLRRYELLPSVPQHSPEVVFETVLKSSNGIRIRLKKRCDCKL